MVRSLSRDATARVDGTINHTDVDSNPPIDSDVFGANFTSIAIRAFLLPWHFELLEPEKCARLLFKKLLNKSVR